MSRFYVCHAIALLCFVFTTVAPIANGSDEGFVPLFNGKDLSGWQIAGGETMSFSVKDGAIYCDGSGNYPHWLRTEKMYENFVLQFEFKIESWCENGLYIHAPLFGRCSKVGLEFQICHDSGSSWKSSGAIFPLVPPAVAAGKKRGEWNRAEIIMEWPRYHAILNGETIQDINLDQHPELKYRNRSGYIGLQDNGWRSWVRNIRIKELPSKENWIPLFNGKNLDGWKLHGGGEWRVENETLIASDGHGHLVNEHVFEDVEIQMYVRTENVANGGVFFRWVSEEDRGREIQIFTNPDANHQTGSIYGVQRASHLPARDGEWFPLQLIIKGSRCIVRINGETVVDYDGLQTVHPGKIALQMHKDNSTIWFRDIRAKRL